MKKKSGLTDPGAIIILVLFSLYQIRAIFNGYWFASHDGIFHLLRAEEFFKMLKSGFFPVRWGLNLDNGYGLPIFNYIYPGPYYLSSILQFLGVNSRWAIRILFAAGYALGGAGFYFLLKKISRNGAILITAVYLLLPYHFLDIFVRGALGEVLVMGLAPIVWLIYERLIKNKLRWYEVGPLALMIICHNFLSLVVVAVAVGYLFFTRRFNINHCLLTILGFGLTSFFWLPMILERRLVASGYQANYTFNYAEHFVYLGQLFYSKWDYWYSVAGRGDGMSFQLGLASLTAVILGIGRLMLEKFTNRGLTFYLLAYLFFGLITTRHSNWLWKLIESLQVVQFPWRFLAITTFLTPLILGEVWGGKPLKRWQGALWMLLLLLAYYNSRNYKRPLLTKDRAGFEQEVRIQSGGAGTTSRHEVAPVWSKVVPYKTTDLELISGVARASRVERSPRGLYFTIDAEAGSKLRANFNYFPAWKLECNDCRKQNTDIWPGKDGEIDLEPEAGRHSYLLEIRSTYTEYMGNIISMATMIILLIIGFLA